MAVAGKHHNVKLDELLSLRMVDAYINFKREALMLFPWILSLHLISMNASPPPLCPKKGEVNILPNIRVIAVLVFTESVKKREQLLQIKDLSW